MIKESRPHIVFLMETHLGDREVDKLKVKFNLFGFLVASVGNSGGLALLWSKDTLVSLQSYSKYHIDVLVQLCNNDEILCFTGFYGEPNVDKKKTNVESFTTFGGFIKHQILKNWAA